MQLNPAIDLSDPGPTVPRPFRLSDAMVLIAALFAAMAWDRGGVLRALASHFSLQASFGAFAVQAASIVTLLLPFLVLGRLAVFALRWQQPRPGMREMLQQPGTVACTLASLASVPVALMVMASHILSGKTMALAWARVAEDLKPERLTVVATLVGLAVLIAWIALLARRQRKPEAGWIDRLGRLIGVGWIAMIFGGMIQLMVDLARVAGAL